MDLPEDDPTQKIVLVDTLPEVREHSPFVICDTRNGEFIIHIIGANPGFKVQPSVHREYILYSANHAG